MNKIIIDRGTYMELVERKRFHHTTDINWEIFQDIAEPRSDYGALEDIVDIMTESYRRVLKEALINLRQHPNKQIIVEEQPTVKSVPTVTENSATLVFEVDRAMSVTIRGDETCQP